MYGTTYYGGTGPDTNGPGGDGVAFEITSTGVYSVRYNFCSLSNCTDGQFPESPLILDTAGNLYGTTSEGGSSMYAPGVVFKLTPTDVESVLYDAGPAGIGTSSGVVMDKSGNLYGTSETGGPSHRGSVYKLTKH